MIATFLAIWSRRNEPSCRHPIQTITQDATVPTDTGPLCTPCLNLKVLGSFSNIEELPTSQEYSPSIGMTPSSETVTWWYIVKSSNPERAPVTEPNNKACGQVENVTMFSSPSTTQHTSRAVQSRTEKPHKLCNSTKHEHPELSNPKRKTF